jgi:hypothetical protein
MAMLGTFPTFPRDGLNGRLIAKTRHFGFVRSSSQCDCNWAGYRLAGCSEQIADAAFQLHGNSQKVFLVRNMPLPETRAPPSRFTLFPSDLRISLKRLAGTFSLDSASF